MMPSLLQGRVSCQKPAGMRSHVIRRDSVNSHPNPSRRGESSSRDEVSLEGRSEGTIADDTLQTYSIDGDKWHPHLSHAVRPTDRRHLRLSTQTAQHDFGVRRPIDSIPSFASRQMHIAAPHEHARHLLLPAYFSIPSSESSDPALLSRLRENGRNCNEDFPRPARSPRVLPYAVGQNYIVAPVSYDRRAPMVIHEDDLFGDAVGRVGFRTTSAASDLIRRQYLDESSLLAEPSSALINAYLYDSSLMYEACARTLTRRLATERLIHNRAMSLGSARPDSSRRTSAILDSINDDQRRPLPASQPSRAPLSQSVGKVATATGLGPQPATRPKAELWELLPFPVAKKRNCHFSQRMCVPLATDEDENWLSEFLCFVRADLVEIFRATEDDVRSRNSSKKVVQGQVGIRCRYCAHLPLRRRASRSSSYPFTLSRIYQSLTMMLRDHFGSCNAIPAPIKERFLMLKGKTAQGATGSNNFWEYSAKKLGLVDSESGIWVDDFMDIKEGIAPKVASPGENNIATRNLSNAPPSSFSTLPCSEVLLVIPEDRVLISDFLYSLMGHVQLVKLEESERIGSRKNLPVGIAGLGCKSCCEKNRKGFCRIFPARRRTLPSKVNDLYEHIRRCPLCPKESRDKLKHLKNLKSSHEDESRNMLGEKDFFDRLWGRMCDGSEVSMDSK